MARPDFRIYIPTYKRQRQLTWELLPPELREKTTLVCDKEQLTYLTKELGCNAIACPVQGRLHRVRQWIVENTKADMVFLMDDDLRLFRRKAANDWHLRNATHKDLIALFDFTENLLSSGYAHVALSARPGNHTYEDVDVPYGFFGRTWMAFAFVPSIVRRLGVTFRTELMSDFDFTLQMLRLGYAQPMLSEWACGQGTSSNSKGGCSTYRSVKAMKDASRKLYDLHPDFVSLVKKDSDWGGEIKERTDVFVQWKRAWESAEIKHGNFSDPKFQQLCGPQKKTLFGDSNPSLINYRTTAGRDVEVAFTETDWNRLAPKPNNSILLRWTSS